MIGFLLFVIGVGWAFSYIYDAPEILFIAVVFSVFMNVFSYWYSDKIALAISGAKPINRETHRELWNITENLCIAAGLPMPKLYIIDDMSPNAFATGRNKENSAVAVTTGLLHILDRSELEGVIAHELSHIGNRDILISTIVVVLVGFLALLSDFFLRMTIFGGGRSDNRDGRLQLILIIIGIVLAVLSPIIATIIQLAISRKREFLADASGALLTRYPEGLASALEKISGHSRPLRRANNATAHMYISNPLSEHGKTVGFMSRLFMTHPPVEERLKALRG
ncbi:MAG: zinc metalloprotease HtpX [Parcubacteria group bacterium CG11_big_fil_rev_8_21_14_0_20_39_22]|nr:MAG: zinc metalloprotease HtpX [Parcubacteria group bacterium CG11_big_fil_rev_8_21_14_0_20_39_22]